MNLYIYILVIENSLAIFSFISPIYHQSIYKRNYSSTPQWGAFETSLVHHLKCYNNLRK